MRTSHPGVPSCGRGSLSAPGERMKADPAMVTAPASVTSAAAVSDDAEAALRLEGLSVTFAAEEGLLPAVQDLHLALPAAAITCLVGESGCGKSLTARAILRLMPPQARLGGRILYRGEDLLSLSEARMRALRGRHLAMIFQEPMTALNPVLRVGDQAAEALRLHAGLSAAQAREEVIRLFGEVGIPAAAERYAEYPHQLSGGMRQRVMIAAALSCRPDILLADEPTTALDATLQGQILHLIREQAQARGMAVLLITHDLGVVARVAAHVGIMYAGYLVEYGPTAEVFAQPLHPYTRGLMESSPARAPLGAARLPAIPGSVPPLGQRGAGCPFAPRCGQALPVCRQSLPDEREENGRRVRCWLHAAS